MNECTKAIERKGKHKVGHSTDCLDGKIAAESGQRQPMLIGRKCLTGGATFCMVSE